jgi:hypothetical protein
MGIACEGMADIDRIRAISVQRAPRLIRHAHVWEQDAALREEWANVDELSMPDGVPLPPR